MDLKKNKTEGGILCDQLEPLLRVVLKVSPRLRLYPRFLSFNSITAFSFFSHLSVS